MSILSGLIKDQYVANKATSNNFNQEILDIILDTGEISKFEILEHNIKSRVLAKFDADLDDQNTDHMEFVVEIMDTARRQTDMLISNSKNKAAFNFWADAEDVVERIVWNKAKTVIKLQ